MNREMPLWERLAVAGLRVTRAVLEVKVTFVQWVEEEIGAQADRWNDENTVQGQALHRASAAFDEVMDRFATIFGERDEEEDRVV